MKPGMNPVKVKNLAEVLSQSVVRKFEQSLLDDERFAIILKSMSPDERYELNKFWRTEMVDTIVSLHR